MSNDEANPIRLVSGKIEVAFQWEVDRLKHSVRGAGEELLAVESPQIDTPVFTEAHPQGEVLFLSGAVKDQLWSMSIEPIDGGLLFDVACRAKSPAAAIGSAYESQGTESLVIIGKESDTSPPPLLQTENRLFTITATGHPPTTPATYRYRYAVIQKSSAWIEKS